MLEGQYHYKLGYNISQNKNIENILLKLKNNLIIENTAPKTIIELGTYRGGFSFLLKDTFAESVIHTFDPSPDCDLNSLSKDANVITHQEDIFEENTTQKIKNLINQEGLTILFVDNGDKPREFNLFSGFLKNGDIILAHDYAPDGDYFNNNMVDKIWNWIEIQDSNINDACIINNLENYMKEEFLSVAWVCKKKIS